MPESPSVAAARPRWYFWVIAVVAILWNAIGALDYVMTQTRNETYMAQFTPEQLEYFYGFPSWAIAAWAVAVWGGVLGALLLLFRRKVAVWFFAVSLAAMLVTSVYNFILSDGLDVMGGPLALAMTVAVVVIGVLLLAYSRAMAERGVLR